MATIPIYDSRNRIAERQLETRIAPQQDPRAVSAERFSGLGGTMMQVGEHFTRIADDLQETKASIYASERIAAIEQREMESPDYLNAPGRAAQEIAAVKEEATGMISNAFNKAKFQGYLSSHELSTTSKLRNRSHDMLLKDKIAEESVLNFKDMNKAIEDGNPTFMVEAYKRIDNSVALGLRTKNMAELEKIKLQKEYSQEKFNRDLVMSDTSPEAIKAIESNIDSYGFTAEQKTDAMVKISALERRAKVYQKQSANFKYNTWSADVEKRSLVDMTAADFMILDKDPRAFMKPDGKYDQELRNRVMKNVTMARLDVRTDRTVYNSIITASINPRSNKNIVLSRLSNAYAAGKVEYNDAMSLASILDLPVDKLRSGKLKDAVQGKQLQKDSMKLMQSAKDDADNAWNTSKDTISNAWNIAKAGFSDDDATKILMKTLSEAAKQGTAPKDVPALAKKMVKQETDKILGDEDIPKEGKLYFDPQTGKPYRRMPDGTWKEEF